MTILLGMLVLGAITIILGVLYACCYLSGSIAQEEAEQEGVRRS